MADSKANIILTIPLLFTSAIDYLDFNIYIPFMVKRIRYINSSWFNATDIITTVATYGANIGYLSSTIPNGNFLCLFDKSTSNKSFDIIYDQPVIIRGSYRFEIKSYAGIHVSHTQNTATFCTLEFCQE